MDYEKLIHGEGTLEVALVVSSPIELRKEKKITK